MRIEDLAVVRDDGVELLTSLPEGADRGLMSDVGSTLVPELATTSETLTIVDNRTGREYTLPIVDGTIRATDLAQIGKENGSGLCRTTRRS